MSFAGEDRAVYWDELVPPVTEEISNPFAELSQDQLRQLATLLTLEDVPVEERTEEAKQDIETIRSKLTSQGLDPDWLFEQRLIMMDARMSADARTNDDLLGQTVRIPGYVLPLDVRGDLVTEFLLVPTVGACIHTPPPPANQMVHVVYPEGFKVEGLYTPVWITGELRGESRVTEIRYVDGNGEVSVSYAMNANAVLPYQ
ncbi:DUF3299 domain-containing protein [Shimia biformata]|uniref:DUF3299 domain-containing protein n=1 Tax=Shimia biformata TaxID=1294299 RepID=UPI001952016A|nr:DUF3299 domain-containing protein [Shimia biformata]